MSFAVAAGRERWAQAAGRERQPQRADDGRLRCLAELTSNPLIARAYRKRVQRLPKAYYFLSVSPVKLVRFCERKQRGIHVQDLQ